MAQAIQHHYAHQRLDINVVMGALESLTQPVAAEFISQLDQRPDGYRLLIPVIH